MGIYAEALRRAITPGCTVIDLGAGCGVFALLACQYGAGSVIAIEPDPSIELMMPLARANGCADRITVIHDISGNYTPPVKADVIVSDCRGTVPLFENHIATLADARTRLLAPGGTLLPMRDTLRIALASAPKFYDELQNPWCANAYDLDLSEGYKFAVNTQRKAFLAAEALISAPVDLATIDYRSITEPDLDARVQLIVESEGEAHGVVIWFDAEIAEGLAYSNAPGQPELVYGQMFLPLEGAPRVSAGDRIDARVRGRLINNEYVWAWDWQVIDASGAARGKRVRQSTFLSIVQSPTALAGISNQRVPRLNAQIILDRDCLLLVGDGRSLDGIAKELQGRHPDLVPSYEAALRHVANCMIRYPDNAS